MILYIYHFNFGGFLMKKITNKTALFLLIGFLTLNTTAITSSHPTVSDGINILIQLEEEDDDLYSISSP